MNHQITVMRILKNTQAKGVNVWKKTPERICYNTTVSSALLPTLADTYQYVSIMPRHGLRLESTVDYPTG